MIGLLGKSRGGRCSPSPDGWLSRGLSIVELAVGFVTTLGRSLGFTSCYDCIDMRRIVPLKIDFLARESDYLFVLLEDKQKGSGVSWSKVMIMEHLEA
ncbi:hypothetical protein DY000_02060604 [Brassica cretica]|uniref:Uncharacterized protein n=1 Tax=Brassica cretica TaxID=69181 RepID=A0ABQ7AW81_BRACR|nr:hypothetical protein DY000_02060604 [Brassica cretica]